MKALLWADAIGISGFCVIGSAKALALGAPPVPAVIMGVMTATFGGILRDMVTAEQSVFLSRDIYITAAFAGSLVYVILALLNIHSSLAVGAGVIVCLFLRSGALLFNWSLPVHKDRLKKAKNLPNKK
jgi:uncharacterized membrane protein YeiH